MQELAAPQVVTTIGIGVRNRQGIVQKLYPQNYVQVEKLLEQSMKEIPNRMAVSTFTMQSILVQVHSNVIIFSPKYDHLYLSKIKF